MLYLFDQSEVLQTVVREEDIRSASFTEQLNAPGSASFTIPYREEFPAYFAHRDPINRDKFLLYRTYSAVMLDEHLHLEGVESAYDDLKADGIIEDQRPTNLSLRVASDNILSGSRWETGTVSSSKLVSSSFYYISRLEAIQKVMGLGLEARFRITISGNGISSRLVDWSDQAGVDRGKRFSHGDGLLKVQREEKRSELYTALIGRGKGVELESGAYGRKLMFTDVAWSVASGDPVNKPIGQNYVEIPERTLVFGFPDGKPRLGIVDFAGVEDPEELLQRTYERLESLSRPLVSYAADVRDEGDTGLGDIVSIIRNDLGIRYKTRIYKREVDLLNPAHVKIELGDKIVSYQAQRISALDAKIESTSTETQLLVMDQVIALLDAQEGFYWGEDGYNYDLRAGNEYGLPAGSYSFDTPIDLSPTKFVYMGAGKIVISDEKNPDGTWKLKTILDGTGLGTGLVGAEQIRAGSITTDHVSTEGLSAESIYIGGGTTVQDKINEFDAIEIGGRNLLLNSSEEKTSSNEYLMYTNIAPIFDEHGAGEYTFSFDLKVNVAGDVNVYPTDRGYEDIKYMFPEKTFTTTTEYKRYSMTVNVTENSSSATHTSLAFYGTYNTGRVPNVKNVKIEKGNKATDWTPAPEDVSAEIASEAADVQRKAEQAAADYADALLKAEKARADAYADNNLTLAEQKAVEEAEAVLSVANANLLKANENLEAFVRAHVADETAQLKTYIRTDPVNGNLLIGAPGSQSMLRQSNLQMTFEYNGVPVAYFGAGETDMPKAGVDTELRIGDKAGGNYYWVSDADGGMSLVWK